MRCPSGLVNVWRKHTKHSWISEVVLCGVVTFVFIDASCECPHLTANKNHTMFPNHTTHHYDRHTHTHSTASLAKESNKGDHSVEGKCVREERER